MRIECSLKEKRSQTEMKEWRIGGWWRTRNGHAWAEYETQHPVSGCLCPGFPPAVLPSRTDIQSNVCLTSYIPFPTKHFSAQNVLRLWNVLRTKSEGPRWSFKSCYNMAPIYLFSAIPKRSSLRPSWAGLLSHLNTTWTLFSSLHFN